MSLPGGGQYNPLDPTVSPYALTKQDKMAFMGGMIAGLGGQTGAMQMATGLVGMHQQQRLMERQQAGLAALYGLPLGGRQVQIGAPGAGRPQAPAAQAPGAVPNQLPGVTVSPVQEAPEPITTPGSEPPAQPQPQPVEPQMSDRQRRAEQMNTALLLGVPAETVNASREAYAYADPAEQAINGVVVDTKDPRNIGREIPALSPGQQHVYDANGNIVGVRTADGYIQSMGDITRAQKDAENASQASYAGIVAQRQEAAKAPYGTTVIKGPNGEDITYRNDQLPGGAPNPAAWGGAPEDFRAVGSGGVAAAPAAAQPSRGAMQIDPQAFYKSFVLPHEGGYNPSDMNGSAVNMGFNQAANPDINVRDLTPEQAAQRFEQKYWGPSGAANLSPALGAIHADTYFINPAKAQQFLAQSKGNPQAYMALRQQWLSQLGKTPKGQPYAKAWANRTTDLRQLASQLPGWSGGAQQGVQTQPSAPGAPLSVSRPANDAQANDLVKSAQDDATQAATVAGLANQFMGLNEKTGTAGVYGKLKLPLIGNINPIAGIAEANDPRLTSMKSLTNQAWVLLRPAGSGRLLETETQGFKQAFPNIGNTGNQNASVALQLNMKRDLAQAKADFYAQYVKNSGGHVEGAQAAWNAQEPKVQQALQQRYGPLTDYYGRTLFQPGGAPPNVPTPWATAGNTTAPAAPAAATGGFKIIGQAP
jgi:lysozyme family protein